MKKNVLRIKIKKILLYLKIRENSFCKRCGRDVYDFDVSDDIWKAIEPHIKYGNVLCYHCFVDVADSIGIKNENNSRVWKLK